jgi:accessory colonization factor AcfC
VKAAVGGNDGANNQPNGQAIHQIRCKRDDPRSGRLVDLDDLAKIKPDARRLGHGYAIFRDTGVALTKRGQTKSEAKQFVAFLTSAEAL